MYQPEEITLEKMQKIYRKRDVDGHKGTFGKILCIGGSQNMQGALALASQAAIHSGAGTCTLFAPKQAASNLRSKLSEPMILSGKAKKGWFSPKAASELNEILDRYDLILFGNGIGLGEGAKALLEIVLYSDKPVVLDADGITLAATMTLPGTRNAPVIFTPHVKEAERLLKKEDLELDDLMSFCQEHPYATILYKSSKSAIVDANHAAILDQPNSSLAKGGSGDVLAGILAGLWPYQKDPFESACLAAFIHNQTAKDDLNLASFTPEQSIANLPKVFKELNQ